MSHAVVAELREALQPERLHTDHRVLPAARSAVAATLSSEVSHLGLGRATLGWAALGWAALGRAALGRATLGWAALGRTGKVLVSQGAAR